MLDLTSPRRVAEELLASSYSLTAVKYENVPLDTTELSEWISVHMQPTDFENLGHSDESMSFAELAMADSHVLANGNMVFNIFTAKDTGTERSLVIAKTVAALFSNKEIDGVPFGMPQLHAAPNMESWFVQVLLVPYTFVTGEQSLC